MYAYDTRIYLTNTNIMDEELNMDMDDVYLTCWWSVGSQGASWLLVCAYLHFAKLQLTSKPRLCWQHIWWQLGCKLQSSGSSSGTHGGWPTPRCNHADFQAPRHLLVFGAKIPGPAFGFGLILSICCTKSPQIAPLKAALHCMPLMRVVWKYGLGHRPSGASNGCSALGRAVTGTEASHYPGLLHQILSRSTHTCCYVVLPWKLDAGGKTTSEWGNHPPQSH